MFSSNKVFRILGFGATTTTAPLPKNVLWALVSTIGVLAKKKKYVLPSIPKVDDDNLTAAETLGMFNITLNDHGFTLIELFIGGDSHVTGLIKKENLEQLKKNAKFDGYMILEY